MIKTLLRSCIIILLFCGSCYAGIDLDGDDDCIFMSGVPVSNYPVVISAWFNTSTVEVAEHYMVSVGRSSTNQDFIALYFGDDDKARYIIRAGGVTMNTTASSASYADGADHNLLGISRAANDHELYVDGISVDTDTTNISSFPGGLDQMAIGCLYRDTIILFWEGQVTEVFVGGVSLTDTQINILGTSKVKRMPLQVSPSIIAYWALNDEPDGTSGDGDTFVNRANPGTHDGTGDNGGNNTGLTAVAETVLTYP